MMKQSVLVIFSGIMLLLSCKSETKEQPAITPQQFNETLVNIEETMAEPILKTEAEIKVRGDRGDNAALIQSATAMEDTVDAKIAAVKELPAIGKGAEDLKTATERYFEYIKSIYTTYREAGEAKTDEEKKAAAEKMNKIISAQPEVMATLKAVQDKYVADNQINTNPK